MKRNFFSAIFFLCFIFLIAFASSCKKTVTETITKTIHDTVVHVITDTVVKTDTLRIVTMSIRPGLSDGQDTYVAKIDSDPSDGNTNLNSTHELVMARASYFGQLATWRGFLRFDSVAEIPSNAKILSAKLYLYGETSSISFNSGNSYYPGSSNLTNPCVIQKVTGGMWDQNTLSWNNAPATTTNGQVTIPESTSQWDYNVAVDVTSFVSDWVSNPSSNFGVCLKLATEQETRVMVFSTSEATEFSRRPTLMITYQY